MVVARPLAYLLTWTAYGTWLPGDERGWVSRLNRAPGSEYNPPSARLRESAARSVVGGPVELSHRQRELVQQSIAETCGYRGWTVREVNCRSNHVHVVLSCGDAAPADAMEQLKKYATRGLRAEGFFVNRKVWTRGGSTRHVNTTESLRRAIECVRRH
jgi:hypothetical protein